jgi:hypothetical protein
MTAPQLLWNGSTSSGPLKFAQFAQVAQLHTDIYIVIQYVYICEKEALIYVEPVRVGFGSV